MSESMNTADPRLERVHRFFNGTGATYDFMVNAATFGIDRLWKKQILRRVPPRPGRILDLACGTGISTRSLARRFPGCRIVGVELRPEYLDIAREKIKRTGLSNVRLVLSRAEDFRTEEPFDCITSSYLAKYADLETLTRNARDMLKPNGVLIMHDFTFPPKKYLVRIWRAYFWALQTVASPLFPSWRKIYHGLPKLIEETQWTAELLRRLRENGFRRIRLDYLTAYGSAIVSAEK